MSKAVLPSLFMAFILSSCNVKEPMKTEGITEEISCFFITADRMNHIVYKGVENPITVNIKPLPADSIFVEVSNGTVRKGSEQGQYYVSAEKGMRTKLTVYSIKTDGTKVRLGSKEYRLKYIDNPIPYVATKTGYSRIRKTQLLASQGVFVRMENFDFDIQPKVVSFAIMTLNADGEKYRTKVEGKRFDEDLKERFKLLEIGDRVFVEEIEVKMPDSTRRIIGPVNLEIFEQ